MIRFSVVISFVAVCFVTVSSEKQQKFNHNYSHGAKNYQSPAKLASLAHSSALQAKTAVRNQQTAGISAAIGAQSGFARAASEAASAAQVAVVAKRLIVQNLRTQAEDAERQLQAEQSQYQQTLQAANVAQNIAQRLQQLLGSVTAVFAAIQQTAQQAEQATAASSAVSARQRQMVKDAEERLVGVQSMLNDALLGLSHTQESARKAAAAAKVAQANAVASSQVISFNSVGANSPIDDYDGLEYYH